MYAELVQAIRRRLYIRIIEPALIEIGKQWEEGNISVGYEHYFSEETLNIIAQLNSPVHVSENKNIGQLFYAPMENNIPSHLKRLAIF